MSSVKVREFLNGSGYGISTDYLAHETLIGISGMFKATIHTTDGVVVCTAHSDMMVSYSDGWALEIQAMERAIDLLPVPLVKGVDSASELSNIRDVD